MNNSVVQFNEFTLDLHIKALPAKLDSSPEYFFGKLASMCLRCD
ncbi:hypothetical protein [Arenibacter echinorum]|nr:hypothetical protein [Arenibacter echinorum]